MNDEEFGSLKILKLKYRRGDHIDGLHLFLFRKLTHKHVNLAGKNQGKYKSRQIKRRFSNGKSLDRVRILFEFRK